MLATRVGRRDALAAVLGVAGLGAVTELAAGKGNNHRNRKQHRRKRRRRNRVGDQPDCAGVLTRAGCSRVHDTALQRDKWVCPQGTNLQDTNLSGCRLEHSGMPGVQLQRAFLNRAVLSDADFRAGNFERATMDGTS